jgi:hypothetical protein
MAFGQSQLQGPPKSATRARRKCEVTSSVAMADSELSAAVGRLCIGCTIFSTFFLADEEYIVAVNQLSESLSHHTRPRVQARASHELLKKGFTSPIMRKFSEILICELYSKVSG